MHESRVQAPTTECQTRLRRSGRHWGYRRPPPCRARPAQSRLGAAGRSQRHQSRHRDRSDVQTHMKQRQRHPRGGLAAAAATSARTACAPRTPLTLSATTQPAPTAAASVWRPFGHYGPPSGHRGRPTVARCGGATAACSVRRHPALDHLQRLKQVQVRRHAHRDALRRGPATAASTRENMRT